MKALIIVIVVLVVVAVLVAVAVSASRRRRREGLRERFGPEYDRAVEAHGGERQADKRLVDIAERRDRLDVRPLDPAERDRYLSEWERVQARFVDDPNGSVQAADTLIGSVMRDRGYPVDDFEARSEMVAVDHPHVVENYRVAHAVRTRMHDGGVPLEDVREAFLRYRRLFAELLETDDRDGGTAARAAGGTVPDRTAVHEGAAVRDEAAAGDRAASHESAASHDAAAVRDAQGPSGAHARTTATSDAAPGEEHGGRHLRDGSGDPERRE